jgi:1-deoxy-D-xylulose-5-phosphate reductoisomerase
VRRNPHRFTIAALSASGRNTELLVEQARTFEVRVVGVADPEAAESVRSMLPGVHIITGGDASAEVARVDTDVVINAVAGAAGLEPTLAALAAGHQLALANKESLIIGGPLVQAAAAPGQIIPVDSEHSALAQCLLAGRIDDVRRLVLTASGGPFRGRSRTDLSMVRPDEALAHPTWSMGPLVTINSATMVNKGLEVIEAHLLFGIELDRIEVVVHPQSIVHSMVEFHDGSTIAQASPPDMRIPIAWAMSHPDRIEDAAPACDWTRASTWEFLPLDEEAFPAVRAARLAGAAAGTAPAVYNGADEVCVAAFLEGRLPFLGIVDIIMRVLDEHLAGDSQVPGASWGNAQTVADVLAADDWARRRAADIIEGGTNA